VVAHIPGEPADVAGIVELARKHNIPVVEDCSQAHGAKLNGAFVGTFGDAAVFSTMYGKHHCTGPQGGVVFTRNEALYDVIRRASDRGKPFGLPEGATNVMATLNSNLGDLCAAVGRAQLKKLPWIVERRKELVAALAAGVKDMGSVGMPGRLPGADPSYWWCRMAVNVEKLTCTGEQFREALAAEGVLMARADNIMPHTMDWYRRRRVFGSSGYPWACPLYEGDAEREFPCPNAHEALSRHINLKLMESWQDAEVADMLTAFRKVDEAFLK